MKNQPKVINLLGAPGSGKSTLAAQLYAALSKRGLRVELVTEVAKEMVWDQRLNILQYQHLVFGLQHQKLDRLVDHVDYIVTDSPLLLSKFYNEDRKPDYPQKALDDLVDAMWSRYDNHTIFINRQHGFHGEGRYHQEIECIEIESRMKVMFGDHIDKTVGSKDVNLDQLVCDIVTPGWKVYS